MPTPELVVGFFAGLSAESRRRRFLQPMPRLPEAMLRRLVEVDGRHHVAEVAVTVTDRYQGRGIGRLLLPVAVHDGGPGAGGGPTGPPRSAPQGAARAGQLHHHCPVPAG